MIALLGLLVCFMVFIVGILFRKIILVLISPIMFFVFLNCFIIILIASQRACETCEILAANQWRIFYSNLVSGNWNNTLSYHVFKPELPKEL